MHGDQRLLHQVLSVHARRAAAGVVGAQQRAELVQQPAIGLGLPGEAGEHQAAQSGFDLVQRRLLREFAPRAERLQASPR